MSVMLSRPDSDLDLPDDPERRSSVELDAIKAVRGALKSSFLANIAVGVLLCAVLSVLLPATQLLGWLAGLVLVQRYRRLWRWARLQVRRDTPDKSSPSMPAQEWVRRFERDSTLLATYWGFTGWWFFSAELPLAQLAVAHALGGLSLVSLGAMAYRPNVMRRFLLIVNLPFTTLCLLTLNPHAIYVGLGMLLMTTYLSIFGRHLSKVVHKAIDLKYENLDLVAELKSQKQQLEIASMAKSRFLAAASHDLRQPAHAVGLLAHAVAQHSVTNEQRKLVSQLQSGVELFSDVVDEILDAAHLDAGELPVNIHRLALGPVLQRVGLTYRQLAADKGLSLLIRIPRQEHVIARTDPALLWRILSNLVSNAIRYTDKGSVLVAVRRMRLQSQSASAPRWAWRVEVRDSGIGIAPEQLALVFEEFYQVPRSTRGPRQGLGLGLSVARRLAELMGATLTVRSRPAVGSVFALTVEKAEEEADSATLAVAQLGPVPRPSMPQFRVLVVDDDPQARAALCELLLAWRVAVRAVDGPATAVSAVKDGFHPDVLLTDYWLADEENALSVALAVCDAMADLGKRGPSIGVLTADVSHSTRHLIEQRGWYFATKPARPPELARWLSGQLFQENSSA